MKYNELTQEQRVQRLATAIRNHLTGTGALFSPWDGADFCFQQDFLCCRSTDNNSLTPLISRHDLIGKSDKEIWKAVMQR